MKLYKHVSRFVFRRNVNKNLERRIRWAETLKSGDLVFECSGFNREFLECYPVLKQNGYGWYIRDVEFEFANGGSCSLRHCGVGPAKSRELIEANYLRFLDLWLFNGQAAIWYDGLDNPKYAADIQRHMDHLQLLKNGGHICDERGVPTVNVYL